MTTAQAIALLAAAGELLLLGLVLRRARRTPLAPPLIGLSLVLFGWNAASFGWELRQVDEWRLLDETLSPLSTPLALHFVASFVGRRRSLRGAIVALYLLLGSLSVLGAGAFVFEPCRSFVESPAWAAAHLLGIAVGMTITIWLLVAHLRSSLDAGERARTRLLLIAMGFAGLCGASELLSAMGLPLPRLAALGVLVGNALLVLVALRIQLFDRRPTAQDAIFAAVVAIFGVGFILQAAIVLDRRSGVATVGVATATLIVLAALRVITMNLREDREQMTQLLNLGRISTQLAHDLRNPLSALRGAAQFLLGEVERGHDVRSQARFFSLILDQSDRMQRVIDVYQRLGRMRPVATEQDLAALVKRTCEAQAFAAGEQIELVQEHEPKLPAAFIDPDLVSNALENLLSNAFRALPNGGRVNVGTTARELSNRRFVVLTVADNGTGMDARTRERATEDFFSSRADGTGLGLAFVQRICDAHGGGLNLVSQQGAGTRVELWFPCAPPPAAGASDG